MINPFQKKSEIVKPAPPSKHHPDIQKIISSDILWDHIPSCFNEDKYTVTQIKDALCRIKNKAYSAAGIGDNHGISRYEPDFIAYLYSLKDSHPALWETARQGMRAAIDNHLFNGRHDLLEAGRSAFAGKCNAAQAMFIDARENKMVQSGGPEKLMITESGDRIRYFTRGDWKFPSAGVCASHFLSQTSYTQALDELAQTIRKAEAIHRETPHYFKSIKGEFQNMVNAVSRAQAGREELARQNQQEAEDLGQWVAAHTPQHRAHDWL